MLKMKNYSDTFFLQCKMCANFDFDFDVFVSFFWPEGNEALITKPHICIIGNCFLNLEKPNDGINKTVKQIVFKNLNKIVFCFVLSKKKKKTKKEEKKDLSTEQGKWFPS